MYFHFMTRDETFHEEKLESVINGFTRRMYFHFMTRDKTFHKEKLGSVINGTLE